MFMKMRRARFFAKFTLSRQSEILRYAQDDSEGLRMTPVKRFSAACLPGSSASSVCPTRGARWLKAGPRRRTPL